MAAKYPNHPKAHILGVSIGLGIVGLFAYAASKFTPGKWIVLLTGLGCLGFLATQVVYILRARRVRLVLQGILLSVLTVVAGTYLLLFGFIALFQDRLANQTASFFQPKTLSSADAQGIAAADVTPLDLVARDDTHLRGWLVRNAAETRMPLLLYFGGSGSEASELIPYAQALDGWAVALVNYRGFGQSDGTPSHSRALDDALFLYDRLATRDDIDPDRVVVMGYSLGTGIAVSLAAQRSVAGTILVAPYDHWSLIGLNKSPIFKPLSGILRPYFDSISLAPGIQTDALCLVGTHDTFVPPAVSHALCGAWGGKVSLIEYPGEDHGLLFNDNNSWQDIRSFLAGVQQ